jgi:hypothetical protein
MANVTSTLYQLARLSANMRAASKGPKAVGRRAVRISVYRGEGRATRKLFRKMGL